MGEIISSYREEDVIFLLKDLSSENLEGDKVKREENIQSGQHYSETLPREAIPPNEYMNVFWDTLSTFKRKVALHAGVAAEQIFRMKGHNTVLVSLARAGTPAGILLRRYLLEKYEVPLPHYSISIIRGRGFDENALLYILNAHSGMNIQFIDGWTGKGAISFELESSCRRFEENYGMKLDSTLAVIADPGHCTSLFGTREDYLIPSACLNSTVSGLISRTVLNDRLIGPGEFHGAKFYREWLKEDVSYEFINTVAGEFPSCFSEAARIADRLLSEKPAANFSGLKDVKRIQQEFHIDNINFIKPGVGETTRVLLRRIPWKILISNPDSTSVKHILLLAKEKDAEVVHYPNMNYTCCGLIKKLPVKQR